MEDEDTKENIIPPSPAAKEDDEGSEIVEEAEDDEEEDDDDDDDDDDDENRSEEEEEDEEDWSEEDLDEEPGKFASLKEFYKAGKGANTFDTLLVMFFRHLQDLNGGACKERQAMLPKTYAS